MTDYLECSKSLKETENLSVEHWNEARAIEAKLDKAEQQIIALKAKLYDMMMGKEEEK